MRPGFGISSAVLFSVFSLASAARAGGPSRDKSDLRSDIASWDLALKSEPNRAAAAALEDRIGTAYVALQEFASAISRLSSALNEARASGDVELMCRCQEDLADAYDKGRWSGSAVSLDAGLVSWYEARGRAEDALRVRAKLAGAYSRAGYNKRALKIYDEVLKENRARGRLNDVANIEYRIGRTLFEMGQYDAAQVRFAESRRLYPSDASLMMKVEFMEGLVAQELGEENEALARLGRTAEMAKALGDDVTRVDALGDMARIEFFDLGNAREALAQYREEAADDERMGVSTSDITNMMFDVDLNSGDLAAAQRLAGSNPLLVAEWALASGHYARALGKFREFSALYSKAGDDEILWAVQTGIGQSLLGLNRPAEALPAFILAQSYIEEKRDTLSERERGDYFSAPATFNSSRTLPYEGEIEALFALGRAKEAFRIAEYIKARMLDEAIARGGSGVDLSPELRTRAAALRDRVRKLRIEVDAQRRDEDAAKSSAKEKELYEAKDAEDRFYAGLKGKNAEFAAVHHPAPLTLDQVRLRPNEYLAEFKLAQDRAYLFLLSPNGTLATRVIPASRAAIRTAVSDYRGQFEYVRSASDLASFDPAKGKELYDLLFGKTLARVGDGARLTIVPDDLLATLPFEALVVESPKIPRLGGGVHGPFPLGVRYLGDRLDLSYAQSATSLMLGRTLRRAVSAPDGVLIVADPVFSARDARVAASSGSASTHGPMATSIAEWKTLGVTGTRERESGAESRGDDEELFPRLQKTGALAESLTKLYGGQATALTGFDATKERLLSLPLERYRDIVFATHGILDETLPYIREPALVLGQTGLRDPREGFLSMHEVLGLHLRADVVALTACQTGIGRNARGEGVMGMGRAFQYAGASNVLMSLWSVAEDATVALTNEYFRGLHDGLSPRAALHAARAAVRRRGYEHPFYWAGFILMSD